jgi:hypothetical protein
MVGLSAGSPILGQQVWDLLKCLDYLESRDDVDNKRIGIFASGIVCLPALLGTALDRRVRSALLDGMLADFESVVASKDYALSLSAVAFGFLRRFDLPEICASIAPRPMWLVNTVGPQGNTLSNGRVYEKYKPAETKSLFVLVAPNPADNIVGDWIKKTLI